MTHPCTKCRRHRPPSELAVEWPMESIVCRDCAPRGLAHRPDDEPGVQAYTPAELDKMARRMGIGGGFGTRGGR